MSERGTGLALAGLGAGLGTAVTVAALLQRTLRPAIEIDAYAKDIATAAGGIQTHLEGAAEVLRTRELAVLVPGLVAAYADRAQEAGR